MYIIENEEGDVFVDKYETLEEAISAAKGSLRTIDAGPITVTEENNVTAVTLVDSEDEDEYIEILLITQE